MFVFGYLVYLLAMAGATYYVLFAGLHPNRVRELRPAYVAGGWVGVWIYWVFMIVVVKATVEQTMAAVFNPMAHDSARPQMQLASS